MSETNYENLNYEDLKLGTANSEGKSVLISDLADRPNSFNSYSESKMSANELKGAFDRAFLYVREKFNSLMDKLGTREVAIDGKITILENAEQSREEAEKAREEAEKAREEAEQSREAARESFEAEVNEALAAQDEKLAVQDARLAGRIGEGDRVTLKETAWSGENTQVIAVGNVADEDMVIFYPATANDREYCGICGVFVSPESVGGSFTVTARAKPVSDILLRYYVIRGRLPEEVD